MVNGREGHTRSWDRDLSTLTNSDSTLVGNLKIWKRQESTICNMSKTMGL